MKNRYNLSLNVETHDKAAKLASEQGCNLSKWTEQLYEREILKESQILKNHN